MDINEHERLSYFIVRKDMDINEHERLSYFIVRKDMDINEHERLIYRGSGSYSFRKMKPKELNSCCTQYNPLFRIWYTALFHNFSDKYYSQLPSMILLYKLPPFHSTVTVKCRTAIKALFLYFNWCLCVK
jgi:hypothetical protein